MKLLFQNKIENLISILKEKVTAIEANHERSISILQNHLQASKQEIEQLKSRLESLRQQNLDNDKEPCQFGVNNDNNKEDMSWTYFERQEGEVIGLFTNAGSSNIVKLFAITGMQKTARQISTGLE